MTTRVMALVVLLALTSCGLPTNVIILLPDENGTVGKVAVHAGTSSTELDKPLAAVNAGSEASLRNVFTAQRSDVDAEFAGALAAAPRAPVVYILYFQTGLTEPDPGSRGNFAAAIAAARGTPNADISVVGHPGHAGHSYARDGQNGSGFGRRVGKAFNQPMPQSQRQRRMPVAPQGSRSRGLVDAGSCDIVRPSGRFSPQICMHGHPNHCSRCL